ncbi:MAG: internalization-like protein competence protein ComEC/Rec2, competence protein ComEC protein [Parcubacteria group bacterium]|nr:internalization-like protein competence protein ComEC/Rec2, competence protein ComEC protein [Parcubacteria group bacterium]
MNISISRSPWIGILAVTLLVGVNIAVAALVIHPDSPNLKVSFLNVGQGDSILIQSPSGTDLLIDGGPDRAVLRELGKKLGLFDRSIDMVVETHPDKDHIAGLSDVLARYKVSTFMSPNVKNDTATFARLTDAVAKEPGLTNIIAKRGMRIHLGDGAYADVLYPDHDVSALTETNDGSIVLHVVYGATSFMLTGDLPSTLEDKIITYDNNDGVLKSQVLKAGHHGSKTSTDAAWLAVVDPDTVVISAGRDNTYGHPAPDTLDRIRASGASILSTIDSGTITFVSDGKIVREE